MKRFLCLFAVLIFIFTAIPVTINAAEEKMNVVYVSDKGNDGADGKSYSMAVKTLSRAMRLCYDGGTIVICGPLKISSSFQSPETEGHITITSVHNGVDYMDSYNAKLQLGAKFILDGEFTLRDMKIETTVKNIVIVCMGQRVIFDEGISCSAGSGANLPSITCGDASNYQNNGARVTVNSGNWLRLRGGNRGTGGSKNGTYIEINGGTFSSVVECGGDSDAYGDAYMLINGGTFNGAIRVVGSTNLHGNAYIAVKGGTIKTFKLSEGGKINGKAEVYISANSGTYTVSKSYATGGATVTRSAKQAVSGASVVSDAAKAEEGINRVADVIKAEFAAIEKSGKDEISSWFDAFNVSRSGSALLGLSSEKGGIELISAKIDVEDKSFNFAVVVAIAIALIAVACALAVWFKHGKAASLSVFLCPVLLASACLLAVACTEKPPQNTEAVTDGTDSVVVSTITPGTATAEPDTDTQAPTTTAEASITTAKSPTTTTEASITTTEASITTTEASITTTKSPTTTTEASITTTKSPTNTTEASITTTAAPVTTTVVPDTTEVTESVKQLAWTFFGGVVNGDSLKLFAPAFAFTDEKIYKNSRAELSVKFTEEGKAYVFAPVTYKEGEGLELTGYCFEMDSENDKISVFYLTKNLRYPIGEKYCKIDVGVEYPVILVFETLNAKKLAFYFNENPLDAQPYPKFEIVPDKKSSGQLGIACFDGNVSFDVLSIDETEAVPYEGLTYKNPIISGMTDPDMFYHEGKYYLYGTRTSRNDGLYCYVSDDGVNFTDAGIVMRAEDVRGDKNFLTANILYHDGYFYIFYHADFKSGETTSQSYAYSTSPLGPFVAYDKNKTLYERDGMLGGQPFVDEDGRIYLVHVQINTGNETWLVEIECDKGKVTVKDETYTQLILATEKWENAIATVLECGYLMKHNNLYYLIYAGGNYNSTYGVGFAVSEKITGPYEKYEGNPILYSNDQAYGNGAASVFPSPDGTEYFFVYLRHSSSVSVRPLNTAMDRFKFVKRENGYDIISVYGPTVTPQPAPSNNGTTTAGELDRFQSNKD